MFKKLVQKFVFFIYGKWVSLFVSCPYINNEAKYMAKGVKPLSTFADDKRGLEKYDVPTFKPLLESGIIKEHRTEEKMKNFRGEDIILLKLNYYYPDQEWRVHRWVRTWDNIDNYRKTIDVRHGLLLGYPKKYIRRHMLSKKIRKWLISRDLIYNPFKNI